MFANRYDPSLKEQFINLSEEELESHLENALSDDDFNSELLDALLTVYSERENIVHVDVKEAWERFQKNYPVHDDMYRDEDADNVKQTSHVKNHAAPSGKGPNGKGSKLLRFGYAAAALVVLITIATVFVNTTATGASIWRFIKAQWSSEVYSYTDKVADIQIDERLQCLHDALEEDGITVRLAPTWIPDGFEIMEFHVMKMEQQTTYVVYYVDDNTILVVQIIAFIDSMSSRYEVDDGNAIIHRRKGIEHSITENEGKVSIFWRNEQYECHVIGDISVDEARIIINSIYER